MSVHECMCKGGRRAPTAVTGAKQARAEIDDTGLVSSFIRDVMFRVLSGLFSVLCLSPFQKNFITLLVRFIWLTSSEPKLQYSNLNFKHSIKYIFIQLF